MKTSRYTKKQMKKVKGNRDCYIEFLAIEGKDPRLSISGTAMALLSAITFMIADYADDVGVSSMEVLKSITFCLTNYENFKEAGGDVMNEEQVEEFMRKFNGGTDAEDAEVVS